MVTMVVRPFFSEEEVLPFAGLPGTGYRPVAMEERSCPQKRDEPGPCGRGENH